jgi:hypothetical protein
MLLSRRVVFSELIGMVNASIGGVSLKILSVKAPFMYWYWCTPMRMMSRMASKKLMLPEADMLAACAELR